MRRGIWRSLLRGREGEGGAGGRETGRSACRVEEMRAENL